MKFRLLFGLFATPYLRDLTCDAVGRTIVIDIGFSLVGLYLFCLLFFTTYQEINEGKSKRDGKKDNINLNEGDSAL